MQRKSLFSILSAAAIVAVLTGVWGSVDSRAVLAQDSDSSREQSGVAEEKAKPYRPKSKAQLRRELSPIQYNVTQNEGTEPAFQNRYWNNKREGQYECVVCGQPLFTSKTKFKSGTGWPSFFAPLSPDSVGTKKDWKLFYTRVEVHCSRCKAHLGHVFEDGPRPTGLRYCMNSASMNFVDQATLDRRKAEQDAAEKKAAESEGSDSTETSDEASAADDQ
ncbi:peptide-methionine (R)-S-oxide reductase MsrB [Crateriforma conspicua]|uniref:peptide-methionine (R)-S-oxide reductase n=1 Tax=Crateriforma conspicua TaxID=2527996 RepID=A0A5C5Y116_9PLAN|nr:peptide-methionine (R)-S-oxide reductase MsrB [Crateriforma conspicua]TWT68351.1 Peptide methionine sulfoxide reductase MsrB [Crateriforma conspicua]